MKYSHILLKPIAVVLLLSCSTSKNDDPWSGLKLNQIQVIATHNSYKQGMDEGLMNYMKGQAPEQAAALDYAHLPLRKQLDMGVRGLELDVFHDPNGGLYGKPYGIELQKEQGIQPAALDTSIMNAPGFKLLHVQDLDFRSHNLTFISALKEIKSWSDHHPDHLPIFISVEPKATAIPAYPEFTIPLPFTPSAFDSLETEVTSVFPVEQIIKPDDIRGDYLSLEEAAKHHNWPSLEAARGKLLFVLNANEEKRNTYLQSHPSLQGRLMFVNSSPGNPECAVIYKNNPEHNPETIAELVRQGYLVRTRAEAGTAAMRTNDHARKELAFKTGAQIISTDYIVPDKRFRSAYMVHFPNQKLERINPVLSEGMKESRSD